MKFLILIMHIADAMKKNPSHGIVLHAGASQELKTGAGDMNLIDLEAFVSGRTTRLKRNHTSRQIKAACLSRF
jgi:hypothetical protein